MEQGDRRVEDYTHLSMRERCLLNTFLSMKLKISEIAKRMDRHRSTLYREISRNSYCGVYMPAIAHEQALERQPKPPNKLDENDELNEYVLNGLKQGWSPEQIAGRMKLEKKCFYVCPESIYRYVYRNKHLGLYKLLPTRKQKRRSRHQRKSLLNQRQIEMRNISNRPSEVELRGEYGHWEGDTIRFPLGQKTCVTTLLERKSRYVCLCKNEDKKSHTVINHITRKINLSPKKVWRSLTFDQGSEFMNFRTIERETKSKIFFCDPHSPWQRGGNENMNGRLRRYLPKKFDIDKVAQDYLDEVALIMNNTPRKCLGFYTPAEVIKQYWKSFCRTSL